MSSVCELICFSSDAPEFNKWSSSALDPHEFNLYSLLPTHLISISRVRIASGATEVNL